MPQRRAVEAQAALRQRRKVLLIFASILLVLLAVLLIWLSQTGQEPFGGQDNRSAVDNPVDGFLLDKIDASSLTPFGDAYVLRLNPNRLSVINLEGAEEYSFTIRSESPQVATAGDYALVFERDGYDYYLAKPQGVIYEGKTQDPIVEGQVSLDGQVALILDSPETRGVLRLMDTDGRHLLDYRLRDRLRSGQLIRANFAQDEPIVDLALLNTDGSSPRPLIHRFDIETAKLNEIYQIDANEVLPIIAQGVGGDLLAIGPQSVYRLEGDSIVPWLKAARIQAALPCQNGAAMIASESFDGVTRLYYLKFSDSSTQLNELPSVVVGDAPQLFVTRNNYVAVAEGSVLHVVNVNTMATERVDLGSNIVQISLDDRGRVLVVTQDRVMRV